MKSLDKERVKVCGKSSCPIVSARARQPKYDQVTTASREATASISHKIKTQPFQYCSATAANIKIRSNAVQQLAAA